MVDSTLECIYRSGTKVSVGKVIPHSNLNRQEAPCKFWCSSPWYFKLLWKSCCCNWETSNSGRSRWKLAEQTVISVLINLVQHTIIQYVYDTTTRNSDQDKVWPPNTPGAQEPERINRRGLNTFPCGTPETMLIHSLEHHQPRLSAYGRKGTLYKWTAHCHLHK